MLKDSYPDIVQFHHHLAAIYYSSSMSGLSEVSDCIKRTVPQNHPEYGLLVGAGRLKRQELTETETETEK